MCSEREPADSLRDKWNVTVGWLPSLTFAFGDTMKRRTFLGIIAAAILVAFAVVFWLRDLDTARRPAREARALNVAHDLIRTTNATMLLGTGPEFRTDLASMLTSSTWEMLDRSPPRDRWGSVRVVLTNDNGTALHMRLQQEGELGRFHFRLVSYRMITEPGGAANRSQPVHQGTNPASAAAGSGR